MSFAIPRNETIRKKKPKAIENLGTEFRYENYLWEIKSESAFYRVENVKNWN